MAQIEYLDVEFHVMGSRRARLQCPHRQEYADEIRLDLELCQRLLELEHSKEFHRYGQMLFEAAFPVGSELHRGIYSVLDSSRRDEQQLRFRLNIEGGASPRLHALHWELLTDGKDFAVGRSPVTVFSRYVSQPQPFGQAPTKPRMLCVIAAPIDAHRYQLAPIDYDYTRRQLEKCFADLRAGLEIDYLERPVTPEKLRDALKGQHYDLLHIHGHGTLPRHGESALVLEDDEHKVCFTTESALRAVLLGLSDLKLVALVACHGGEPSSPDEHLSGLAGSLVRQNVPAIIAMRRAISMKVGFLFTRHFYHQLAQSPCVDAAVNEARHRLYMENPEGVDWSSPVLYMRLADGLLWSADETGADNVAGPGRNPQRVAVKGGLVLLAAVISWWSLTHVFPPGEPLSQVVENTRPEQMRVPEEEKPEPPSPVPAPPPAILLDAIETGKIGVAAIDSETLAWTADIAKILSRQLRKQRPDLTIVLAPEPLHSKLKELTNGNFSSLPGGGSAPGGLEYLLLVVQDYTSIKGSDGFPAFSVSCEMFLIATRRPGFHFSDAFSHTGKDVTQAGALEQAFGRCIEVSISQFP